MSKCTEGEKGGYFCAISFALDDVEDTDVAT